MKRLYSLFAGLCLGIAALGLMTGCEIDSAESSSRTVDIIVDGFYANGGAAIVSQNTGNNITSLDLRQSGDQLEGVDNNGNIFKGTIGSASESSATITLNGLTTAGADATISGSIDVSGTTATMRGTWIEPTLFSTVYAQATVPTNNNSGTSLSISGSSSMTVGNSQTLTVSGGNGSYSWSISNSSIGNPSSGSGSSFNYSATAAGTQTITCSDTGGHSDSISISQS